MTVASVIASPYLPPSARHSLYFVAPATAFHETSTVVASFAVATGVSGAAGNPACAFPACTMSTLPREADPHVMGIDHIRSAPEFADAVAVKTTVPPLSDCLLKEM